MLLDKDADSVPAGIDPVDVAARLEKALSSATEVPLLPATAEKAVLLARQRDVALGDFARLIESDVALAAAVLKLANSPLYSWGRTIDGVKQAVVRLGLQQCVNLITAVALKGLTDRAPAAVRAPCRLLWQHSFVVGCLCRQLATELSLRHDGEEFTAGLMHDLGRIVIALVVPEAFLAADPMTFDEGDDALGRERQVLGCDHCTVGARYAEQSRMPRSVISVIRNHHLPGAATASRGLVELVVAADHLGNYFQRGRDPEAYDLSTNPGFAALAQGLQPGHLDCFQQRLPAILKEASQALLRSGLR